MVIDVEKRKKIKRPENIPAKNAVRKFVGKMNHWARVAQELEGEDLKEKIYDNVLFSICGDVKGKRILDYGPGPAVIASRATKLGADVKVYDISAEMLAICAEKLGKDSVYYRVEEIPEKYFDIILCSLVLCIVDEEEVANIVRNIRNELKDDGVVYVGFCNPLIYDVPESVLDFRIQTENNYEDNHVYKKVKKEGNYEILELHRPIEWYQAVFEKEGLKIDTTYFTPGYTVEGGREVNDFVIFKLVKKEAA